MPPPKSAAFEFCKGVCGSPGCGLPDFHPGLCRFESVGRRRTPSAAQNASGSAAGRSSQKRVIAIDCSDDDDYVPSEEEKDEDEEESADESSSDEPLSTARQRRKKANQTGTSRARAVADESSDDEPLGTRRKKAKKAGADQSSDDEPLSTRRRQAPKAKAAPRKKAAASPVGGGGGADGEEAAGGAVDDEAVAALYDTSTHTGKYSAEYAKTGRAKCRVCGELIALRELRVGVEAEEKGWGVIIRWQHIDCTRLPAGLAPEDLGGYDELLVPDQRRVAEMLSAVGIPAHLRPLEPDAQVEESAAAWTAQREPPPSLVAPMLPYQKEGLAWMCAREIAICIVPRRG